MLFSNDKCHFICHNHTKTQHKLQAEVFIIVVGYAEDLISGFKGNTLQDN